MISQVMSGDRTHRTIEDIDETVLNAAQMKAIASGDPQLWNVLPALFFIGVM